MQRATLSIVVLVWAAMCVAALALVATYGTTTLPQNDELWALYDAGPGIDIPWLWHTWAEHRIPLAKLIWKAVLQITNYNFRTGDFITVLLLAASALGMIMAARRIRGRTILADAFFPLAVLSFGQAQVFLWWWQINHVLAPVTASFVMVLLVVRGNDLQRRHVMAIAGSLILLVLCGPGGLPYVAALGFFLIVRRDSWGVVAMVAVALGLLGFYFVDFHPYFPVNDPPTVSSWPEPAGVAAAGLAYVRILGLSLGTATKPYATASGLGVLVFALVTVGMLARIWLEREKERWRAFGLAVLLGAQAVLVGVIAWSRGGMGVDYLYLGHYLTLVAPALCGLYFVWEMQGGRLGRAVQFAMLGVLVVLLPTNLRQGVAVGKDVQFKTEVFARDVRRGIPAFVLAERHFASDVVPRADKLTTILKAHKANGIGVFREIVEDPRFEVVEVAPKLEFSIGEASRVYAVRLRYAYVKAESLFPTMRVYWRNGKAGEEFAEERMYASTVSGPDQPGWALVDGKIHVDVKVTGERTLTVWVDAAADEIRIVPDTVPTTEMRLSKVEVMVGR